LLWGSTADSNTIIKPPLLTRKVVNDVIYHIQPFQLTSPDIQSAVLLRLKEYDIGSVPKTWPGGSDVLFVMTFPTSIFVGFVAIDRRNFYPCISNLFIDPVHRAKGFAKTLVDFAERFVFNHIKFNIVKLWCTDELVPFYQKLHYVKEESDSEFNVMHKKQK
jgi:GNAT superfamily N-acetyltransferase